MIRTAPDRLLLAWFVSLLFLVLALPAQAAPSAELWQRWDKHDENGTQVVNHGAWETFLSHYVVTGDDGINRVRYADVSREDAGRLAIYVQDLARVPVTKLRRDEQYAYWINLYNAFTVKLVVDRYPMLSLRDLDISPGFLAKGPWGAAMILVENETLTLDDIEHRILRPIWNDPRTHYALCYAALGSPNLAQHAYTAATVDSMLEAAAWAYVNHPRGAQLKDGKLRVSSLYDWYEKDFGGNDASVIEHLKRYAMPEFGTALAGVRKVSGDSFDWALNDAHPPQVEQPSP